MKEQRIYEGASVVDCELGNHIVVGQDSFLKDSVVGDYVQINRRNILENVVVGNCSYTGANTIIKHTDIGKYCAISWNVSMTGNVHDYSLVTPHPFALLKSFGFVEQNISLEHKKITIGNDVWIGANASILAGTTIGDGAIIGAGGVVTKDIPPYAIAVGNPCKVIKYRFSDEIVSDLLHIKWWDWPRDRIKENINLFQSTMTLEVAKELLQVSKELS